MRKTTTNTTYKITVFDGFNIIAKTEVTTFQAAVTIARVCTKNDRKISAYVGIESATTATKHNVYSEKTYIFKHGTVNIISTDGFRFSKKNCVMVNQYHKA